MIKVGSGLARWGICARAYGRGSDRCRCYFGRPWVLIRSWGLSGALLRTSCPRESHRARVGSTWGPPLFCAISEGRTEPAFAVASCICASSWLLLLLSWSFLGAHPVAGYAWCPPRVGERVDGWVDGKGEGVGCFVRVICFETVRKHAAGQVQNYACSHIYTHTHIHIWTHTSAHTSTGMHVRIFTGNYM